VHLAVKDDETEKSAIAFLLEAAAASTLKTQGQVAGTRRPM
jgi:hypothetical protein